MVRCQIAGADMMLNISLLYWNRPICVSIVRYFIESPYISSLWYAWRRSIFENFCPPANFAKISLMRGKGYCSACIVLGSPCICNHHRSCQIHLSLEQVQWVLPNHLTQLSWEYLHLLKSSQFFFNLRSQGTRHTSFTEMSLAIVFEC